MTCGELFLPIQRVEVLFHLGCQIVFNYLLVLALS